MMRTTRMDLWPIEPARHAGRVRYGVRIEGLPSTESATLWCEVPQAYERRQADQLDAFVIGVLQLAMQYTKAVHVHGTVSPSLLVNLEWFQSIWACWFAETYAHVAISADTEREPTHGERAGALASFSGGVDSCFTVYRHHQQLCGRLNEQVAGGLMVHGFDIPANDHETFARAAAGSERMLQSIGLPLLTVRTNFRELVPAWEYSHGTALAMAMTLLDEYYDTALIAASWGHKNRMLKPWGSNPLTDGMLGSQSFRVVHDGAAFDRWDKLSLVSPWPSFRDNLRVCWEGASKDRNCGRCEKCIRNILLLRALGYERLSCFDHDVTDEDLRRLWGLREGEIVNLQLALSQIQESGVKEVWVELLADAVARNRRQLRGIRRYGRLVRKGLEQLRRDGVRPAFRRGWRHVRGVETQRGA